MNNRRLKRQIAFLCCLAGLAGCGCSSKVDDGSTAQARSTDHAEAPSVMGLIFNFKPGELDAYVSDFPRYLRIKSDPAFDLILDERTLVDISEDYMSVLPVQYGHGIARELGSRTIWCIPDQLFYRCGTKLGFRGRKVVLLWRDEPQSASAVEMAVKATSSFLAARLIEERPSEASLNGAKMRGYKPSAERDRDPPLQGTWSPSRRACPADPWTFIGFDPVRLERSKETCTAKAIATGIDGALSFRAVCKDTRGEHTELWALRQRGPVLTFQRSRSASWGDGPATSHTLERCG